MGNIMSLCKNQLTKSLSNRGNFSIIPNEYWELDISLKAKVVYGYIIAQAEFWNPSLRAMSKKLNISVNTIRSAIEELRSANMLQISSEAGACNQYILTSVDVWQRNTDPLDLDFDL